MRLAAALCLLTVACGPPEPITELSEAITYGTSIPGQDMATVFVIARRADNRAVFLCSGALITSRIVMTAAHCADGSEGDSRYDVHFADSYDQSTRKFSGAVDEVLRSAEVVYVHPQWNGDPRDGRDFALYYLDKAAPASVAPYEIGRYRVTSSWMDKAVRMVGWGEYVFGSDDPVATKRQGKSSITGVQSEYFLTHGRIQTCEGDSGGPIFVTVEGREVIAGIASFGYEGCSNEDAGFTRLDPSLALLKSFIAEHDPQAPRDCGADGKCGIGCTAIDPDCPCVGDGLCTTACNDTDLDPDCPLSCSKNDVCVRTGCPTKDPDCGEAAVGTVCAKNEECLSNLCFGDSSQRVCAVLCGSGDTCDDGFHCSTAKVCVAGSAGDDGCCSIGGRPPSGGGWLLFALFFLWRRRASA